MIIRRQPTTRTYLALVAYVAILCTLYRTGSYSNDQERDAWFALPFSLIPFFLPTLILSNRRVFGICYALFASYLSATVALERPPFIEICFALFWVKALPSTPYGYGERETVVSWVVSLAVLSGLYGLTGILAGITHRRRGTEEAVKLPVQGRTTWRARSPTVLTGLALCVYLGALWSLYRLGLPCQTDARDVWLALPVALLPFVLSIFIHSNSRLFWSCYVLTVIAAFPLTFLINLPGYDVDLLLFCTKALPPLPTELDSVILVKYFIYFCASTLFVSFAYPTIAVLVAKTYRTGGHSTNPGV